MMAPNARRRTPLRVLAAREDGVTLLELMVAITLFAVLATLIVSSFSTFTQTLTRDRVATENTNIASLGMDELTRVIRASTSIPVPGAGADLVPFVVADRETLTIYAFIDTSSATPRPVKVQFAINATTRELVETRWDSQPKSGYPSYWEFKATPASVNVIARRIVIPAAGEAYMFRYYKIDPATLHEVELTVPATGGLVAADLARIAVVEVTVKVQSDDTQRAKPVTIINRVGIPNLGISRLGTN